MDKNIIVELDKMFPNIISNEKNIEFKNKIQNICSLCQGTKKAFIGKIIDENSQNLIAFSSESFENNILWDYIQKESEVLKKEEDKPVYLWIYLKNNKWEKKAIKNNWEFIRRVVYLDDIEKNIFEKLSIIDSKKMCFDKLVVRENSNIKFKSEKISKLLKNTYKERKNIKCHCEVIGNNKIRSLSNIYDKGYILFEMRNR